MTNILLHLAVAVSAATATLHVMDMRDWRNAAHIMQSYNEETAKRILANLVR